MLSRLVAIASFPKQYNSRLTGLSEKWVPAASSASRSDKSGTALHERFEAAAHN